jgi:hypothetical protein
MSNIELFTQIKNIANEAVSSYHTKDSAKPFIMQLQLMGSELPNTIRLRTFFSSLVGHVTEASGRVRNKQHWLYFVERDLCEIENELIRTKNNLEA